MAPCTDDSVTPYYSIEKRSEGTRGLWIGLERGTESGDGVGGGQCRTSGSIPQTELIEERSCDPGETCAPHTAKTLNS